MISPELRARIRRLFYAEHWKIGTIAAELGVHRDTVALAVEAERFTVTHRRPTYSPRPRASATRVGGGRDGTGHKDGRRRSALAAVD